MLYKIFEAIAFVILIITELELLVLIKGIKDEPKPSRKKKKPNTTDKEQQKLETLLANLEVYDGTSIGQRKIDE